MSDVWNLNTLWFGLIGVLWIGFFFLEGFDFGVGILTRFLARDAIDKRVMVNTIGPVWDGNEVWLLVAGGATFAAFPEWYATLFSGFYLALFVVLVALIVRGVAFEFRGKAKSPRWQRAWDEAMFLGSALPAVLFGVAFANMLRGVPIDAHREYVGTFFDLLNPYALEAGVTWLLLCTLHGAIYLSLKTEEPVQARARAAARRLAWPTAAAVLVFLSWTYVNAVQAHDTGVVPGVVPVSALGSAIAATWLVARERDGWAFVATGLTTVMSVVALIFTPLVLAYQGWTYWIFRKRIGRRDFERPFLRIDQTLAASHPSVSGDGVKSGAR